MNELIYGIDAWYPVLRGGAAPAELVDLGRPGALDEAVAAWDGLGHGERLAVRAGGTPAPHPALPPPPPRLPGEGFGERFVELPGPRGRSILVPTRDGASLRGGLTLLPGTNAGSRTLRTMMRATSPFGIALRGSRPALAVWTKGDPETANDDLPLLPVAGTVAVAIDATERSQSALVRALDRRGAARIAMKIGLSERTDDAVEREARSLTLLSELVPGTGPELMADGRRAGRAWLAHDVLEGRYAGDALSPAHARLLAAIAAETRDEQTLSENRFFQEAQRHLAALDPAEDPDWHAEYDALLAALEESMDGSPLPVTLAHGDFAPWNLVRRRREVRAFDWEHLAEDAPALYDLVHFRIQAGAVLKQQRGERIFDDLERYFAGPASAVVRAAGVERRDVLRLVALYVLHEGTTSEVAERLRPAARTRTSWLRHAQRALCRRLTGLLTERSLPTWTRVERPRRAA
ncbi:MAG: hypothetical protein AAGA20_21280 [Planctomycetota bacterium]